MSPAVDKSNAKHYEKSLAVTEYYEFAGRDHWTCAAPGWEAVADRALDWALAYADTKPRGRHPAQTLLPRHFPGCSSVIAI